MNQEPLVTVITPVYNGEAYIRECIESVLKQEYTNFEYIIVNNCSKDRTLEIATEYAKKDSRIRVHDNTKFVGVIENHNIAFRLMSRESKYCKVVSADDWVFPHCLKQLVALAEANPSVVLVSSYQVCGTGKNWLNWRVNNVHLPYPSTVVSGREVCRFHLLGTHYVFGAPTAILYRSDIIRAQENFYPNPTSEADASACFKYLQGADFGFVHEVLSYERVHEIRQTAESGNLNAYLSSKIGDLLAYGRSYLSESEFQARLGELLQAYYNYLAQSLFEFRNAKFWEFHRTKLDQLGYPLNYGKLTGAAVLTLVDMLLHPKETAKMLLQRRR